MPSASRHPEVAVQTVALSRSFGSLVAVDAINLTVRAGSIYGLLGPNGAGKSTTIKMLTTLLPPTSGTARIFDSDIIQSPDRVRRHIGYVPQMLSADGGLTARENLLLSACLYGIPRRERRHRIDEAIEFAGLTEAAGNLVRTYSGGMIRRLELAQAMLHRPLILVLDEPTIGLDPVGRMSVRDRLLDLRKKFGMTVLITTHDMEEADELCDEIAIMHRGRIAASGSPAHLKAAVGRRATLDQVFIHFAGSSLNEEGGTFRDVRQTRRTARRLG